MSARVRAGLRARAAGDPAGVGIGTSLFLIAVGAILYFAVDANVSGLSITTVGLILMIVGIVGLAISLYFLSSARGGRPLDDRRGPRDGDYY